MTYTLHYDVRTARVAGIHRPLVALHELGGSTLSWRWALPYLGRERDILVVDLPGHGQSPSLETEATLDVYAALVVGVLESLAWQTFDLVGVALGGIVAPFVDRRLPDKHRRVVLSATPFVLSAAVAKYCRDRAAVVQTSGMERVVDDSLSNSFPPHLHGSRIEAEYRALFLRNDPIGYAAASYALANLDNDRQRENFIHMRGRVGLIGGAQDPLFPVTAVKELSDFLELPGGPVVLPHAGHFPHIQDASGFAIGVDKIVQRED